MKSVKSAKASPHSVCRTHRVNAVDADGIADDGPRGQQQDSSLVPGGVDQRLFVPLTDELMYDRPEQIRGELVAYEPGHTCAHWLCIELNPVDDPPIKRRPAPGRENSPC